MRVFFDTEFIEDGSMIWPISIGIVRADGEEYYAEFAHVPWWKANPWVKENVLPHLQLTNAKSIEVIRDEIVEFVGPSPEWWAYYADYDWVLLCQLYGSMMQLPSTWPMFCRDLRQLMETMGVVEMIHRARDDEHHALADAREVRDDFDALHDMASHAEPDDIVTQLLDFLRYK